ncbi:MAG: hypothetical protein AAGA48_04545 [Myxococcota bacterium]
MSRSSIALAIGLFVPILLACGGFGGGSSGAPIGTSLQGTLFFNRAEPLEKVQVVSLELGRAPVDQ